MTSIRQLKLIYGAGEPDSVLARRIDVVAAAECLYDAVNSGATDMIDACEDRLYIAVRRYRGSVKRRNEQWQRSQRKA